MCPTYGQSLRTKTIFVSSLHPILSHHFFQSTPTKRLTRLLAVPQVPLWIIHEQGADTAVRSSIHQFRGHAKIFSVCDQSTQACFNGTPTSHRDQQSTPVCEVSSLATHKPPRPPLPTSYRSTSPSLPPFHCPILFIRQHRGASRHILKHLIIMKPTNNLFLLTKTTKNPKQN